ncbi:MULTISPECIES: biotin synthase BioB [Cycloclasticus]|uniref:Biotin synthase n=1 Tax=Cycloclasticus pugetii TaxID=34068 RepID=A0AB33Z0P5_9GAMM|nr:MULTISPECIES: biotin synthase BioB [Cycloclasticus]ATI02599.1 biotin synthase BioB [Cycloclasticus sp. PY97N]EPD12775.1 biotin synthase, contains an iron-sulfur cluster and PLP [Cycloclasticus pugetii]
MSIASEAIGEQKKAAVNIVRNTWPLKKIQALFDLPFNDLLFKAHTIHRENFDPNAVQISTLLSIKTGACPEDCSYCPQSVRYDTGLEKEALMEIRAVVDAAKEAKANGASRFCMGAAWRSPKDRDLNKVTKMVEEVKALGMETCVTLGMLEDGQAKQLKDAGLDYYNHNIDTSEDYYKEVITTRTYQDRLDTIDTVRNAGINVCSGGIVGMGEASDDRAKMLQTLANMEHPPESVPINKLVQVKGTPLDGAEAIDSLEFIKTIAVARILMPTSQVRLSAGRSDMTDEMQAMCFFAGANSIFYGDQLLTTENPEESADHQLFKRLGIYPATA